MDEFYGMWIYISIKLFKKKIMEAEEPVETVEVL